MSGLFLRLVFPAGKLPNYPNVDIALPKHIPGETDDEPVEDLKEGDEAETKAEPKEAAHA